MWNLSHHCISIENKVMKYFLLLLIFFCVNNFLWAQPSAFVEISLQNKNNTEPVRNAEVSIRSGDSIWNLKSHSDGKVSLTITLSGEYFIEVRHGFYSDENTSFRTQKVFRVNDTIRKTILLTPLKIKTLDEHTVLAPGAVKIVYQSEKLSVADFEIFPNGELLLLAYPKTLKKGSELLVYNGKTVLNTFKLKENPLELIRDYRGNAHVVCEKGVYGIYRMDNNIGISNLDKSYFMKYVFPIVDTIQSKLFFSNFNPNYPAFDYMSYDQRDSSYVKIMEIKDDLMMELYRSEYKWVDVRTKLWAYQQQLATGIDKEIWVGANYFTNSLYYKQLYAPMFQRNDSIFVFDYYKDQLFTFNAQGEKLDSVAIFHHYQPKQTGWKRQLLQDNVSGEIYAFFEKNGICSVRKINMLTGGLGPRIQFEHKYVDKIAISGNTAYYIYRPYESAQKKFLYMTQLPY